MIQYTAHGLGIVGMGAVGLLAGVGAVDTWERTQSEPRPYAMALDQLIYQDGKICQKMQVLNTKTGIGANWTAVIKRLGEPNPICVGSGRSIYESNYPLKCFTPSEWTLSDCPPLETGDVAYGEWEYTNAHGYVVKTTGSVDIE